MLVGAKVCELTDGFLWFVCGLYVGILTSPLTTVISDIYRTHWECQLEHTDNMVPPPGAIALTTSATQTPKNPQGYTMYLFMAFAPTAPCYDGIHSVRFTYFGL